MSAAYLTARAGDFILPRPMPISNGTVTFARFHVEPTETLPSDLRRWLSRGLRARAFEAIDRRGEEERSAGFVEHDNHDATELSAASVLRDAYVLAAWRVDTLKPPPAELKAELASWTAAYHEEHGRAPGRREKAEQRALLRQKLRSEATPVTKVFDLSWNIEAEEMKIWTSSRKVIDEIVLAMESGFRLRLHARVPSAVAQRREIADEVLAPTPALMGMELSGRDAARLAEVTRG